MGEAPAYVPEDEVASLPDVDDGSVTAAGEAAAVLPDVDGDANPDKFAEYKDKGRDVYDAAWNALQKRMQAIRARMTTASAREMGRELMGQAFTVPARLETAWQSGRTRLGEIMTSSDGRIGSARAGFNRAREAISSGVSDRLASIRASSAERSKAKKEKNAAEFTRIRQEQIDRLLGKVTDLRAERDAKNMEIMQAAYAKVKENRAEYRGKIGESQKAIAELQANTSGNVNSLNHMAYDYSNTYIMHPV